MSNQELYLRDIAKALENLVIVHQERVEIAADTLRALIATHEVYVPVELWKKYMTKTEEQLTKDDHVEKLMAVTGWTLDELSVRVGEVVMRYNRLITEDSAFALLYKEYVTDVKD